MPSSAPASTAIYTLSLHDALPICLLTLGKGLVIEHVGMSALLAEVHGKGIAGPQSFQAGILFESRLRDDRARIRLRRRPRDRFAAAVTRPLLIDGAHVAVVLLGEILSPDRGILGVVRQIDDAIKRISRFLLALEDVHQK